MKKQDRLVVDPTFKRVIALESVAFGFPSIRKYTEYLGKNAIKNNKKLRDLIKEENIYEKNK